MGKIIKVTQKNMYLDLLLWLYYLTPKYKRF